MLVSQLRNMWPTAAQGGKNRIKVWPYSVVCVAGQSLVMERTNGTTPDATIQTTRTGNQLN